MSKQHKKTESAKKHLEKFRDQFESGDSPRKYLDE